MSFAEVPKSWHLNAERETLWQFYLIWTYKSKALQTAWPCRSKTMKNESLQFLLSCLIAFELAAASGFADRTLSDLHPSI